MRTLVPAAILGAALLVGCGDGGGSGACGPVQREPLDTRGVHVLPGAAATEYRTDPPTSGPHQPAPVTESVRSEPIAKEVQVGLLEEGRVLIQHDGLTATDQERLEELAVDDEVVVAPAESLPDDATVVATAWVTKQVCTGLDVDALAGFVADHEGNGPGGH